MEEKKYKNAEELLSQLSSYGSIHVECSRKQGEELLRLTENMWKGKKAAFITLTDKGYERDTVKSYLKFYRNLFGCRENLEQVLKRFGLAEIARKRVRLLKPEECMRMQFARISMQGSRFVFLEEPLLNMEEDGMKKVLCWMEEESGQGTQFVTANVSLRCALLMPGTAFSRNGAGFCELETEEGDQKESQDVEILKLPVKSGNTTLLLEPGDIDYIESLSRNNYVSVRGESFLVSKTMEELETLLQKSGFFRCHRSYIVNVQKVERLERMTKNSYALILNNEENSQVPLAKGRIEEMKQTFGW